MHSKHWRPRLKLLDADSDWETVAAVSAAANGRGLKGPEALCSAANQLQMWRVWSSWCNTNAASRLSVSRGEIPSPALRRSIRPPPPSLPTSTSASAAADISGAAGLRRLLPLFGLALMTSSFITRNLTTPQGHSSLPALADGERGRGR